MFSTWVPEKTTLGSKLFVTNTPFAVVHGALVTALTDPQGLSALVLPAHCFLTALRSLIRLAVAITCHFPAAPDAQLCSNSGPLHLLPLT